MKKTLLATFLGMALSFTALVTSFTVTTPASAVSASEFNAGRIIDDEIFYNKNAMGGPADIQAFIRSHTPTHCDTWGTQPSPTSGLTNAQYAQARGWHGPPYACLQNYHENPNTGETSFERGGGAFAGGQDVGTIIWNAAQDYSINPQVLLVTLRKESLNLFGDNWPLKSQYRYAMGYGCPDSGPNYSANCAADKAGLYKQIRLAAWQFRHYYNNMGSYNYAPGRVNRIQYNPQPSCGTKDVYIENYATASLYIYTPYTPNDAALNAYPGTAHCGAYGNRNFWFMFQEWFGSTIVTNPKIISNGHVSSVGWMNWQRDNATIGTTGQGKSLEALAIQGEVEYSSYTDRNGWQPNVNLGMVSGSVAQELPIRAVKIKPLGSLADKYNIYYRAHVSNIGWMSWTLNGSAAGVTGGSNNKIEAIEIRLVQKNVSGPTLGGDAYRNHSTTTYNPNIHLSVSSHVQNHGWQPSVTDSMVSGTFKQKLRIEAAKIKLTNNTGHQGGIVYSSHVAGIGWQDYVTSDAVSGTIKQSRQMEAIRVALTGDLADHYDVWYRTHVQDFGWLGWSKNNQPAGTTGAGKRLESMEVRIVPKNSLALSSWNNYYNPKNKPTPSTLSFKYAAHARSLGWLSPVGSGGLAGTVQQSRHIEAIRIATLSSALSHDVSVRCYAYAAESGWINNVAVGNTCGTTGQNEPMQALRLQLTGTDASLYTLTFRAHVSESGWTSWKPSGETVGEANGNSIEAVEVKMQPIQ